MTENPYAGKIDDELLAQVTYLFRKVVPGLRRRLVNRVGSSLRVALGEVGSASIGECLDVRSSGPAAVGEFQLAPNLKAMVIFEGNVLCRFLGMMLGEDPDKPIVTARPILTRVDLRIGRRICEDFIDTLGVQTGLEGNTKLLDVRPAPRSLGWIPRSSRVLTAALEFGPEDAPFGKAQVVLPLNTTQLLFGSAAPLGEARAAHVESILPVQVEVIAELARVKMAIAALSNLSEGSMIELGRPGDVRLTVNGKTAIYAEGGESDGMRSVRILGRSEAVA